MRKTSFSVRKRLQRGIDVAEGDWRSRVGDDERLAADIWVLARGPGEIDEATLVA